MEDYYIPYILLCFQYLCFVSKFSLVQNFCKLIFCFTKPLKTQCCVMILMTKRVILLAESTLLGVYMREKLTPLPESRAACNDNRAYAYSDFLTLTELTWLGKQECLYGEKLAWLGG